MAQRYYFFIALLAGTATISLSQAESVKKSAARINASCKKVWKSADSRLPRLFDLGYRGERAQELYFLLDGFYANTILFRELAKESQPLDLAPGLQILQRKAAEIDPLLQEFGLDQKAQHDWNTVKVELSRLQERLGRDPIPAEAGREPVEEEPTREAATPPPLDFAWPLAQYRLLSVYGDPRGRRKHKGLDLGARRGAKIRAAAAGVVRYSGSGMRGYGKTVIVDHGDGWESLYAHNSRLLVKVGQRVSQGEVIALVGRTGNATANHVHFELRHFRKAVDPLPYLGFAR